MRFMVVNRPTKAQIFGHWYDLKPLQPSVFEPDKILVADNGSAYELLVKHQSVLLEASFDISALSGFPVKHKTIDEIKPASIVLIIRAGGVGDHVMFLPALAAFRRSLPSDVDVWLSTQKEKHPIFYLNQAVDKLLPLPLTLDTLLKADFIIDFSDSLDNDNFNSMNMTDYYMSVLGVDKEMSFEKCPYIQTNPENGQKVRSAINDLRKGEPFKPIVAIQWKSSNPLRDLPPEKLLCLTDSFPEIQFITPIPLDETTSVSKSLGTQKNKIVDISFCIESLDDYITLFELCDGAVSTDTAAYHLAQAFGKPAVVLFGPIASDLRLRYYDKAHAIDSNYKGQSCGAPCGLHKVKDKCPEARILKRDYTPCLSSLSQQTIVEACKEMCDEILISKEKAHMNIDCLSKNRPTISACMIVKNEEELLPGCLKSVKDYVDEIIVVDTGSTDKTVSIAESFGAHVYHHPWENNFSKHRNQSFGYAKGDWIFYIDADEELLPGSGDALRAAILTDGDVDALVVTLQCIFNQGGSTSYNNSIRVFRNHRGLRYEGRVHNYIVGVKKAICAPIHIFHYGYNLNEESRKRKFKRTTELLIKEIQEDPENPRPHHFLGASFLSESMFEEAAKEAMEAIRLFEKRGIISPTFLWSIYNASSAYFHMGEVGNAEILSKKGIELYSYHIDSHYMLSLVAYEKKDRKMFEHHMLRYLEAKNSFEKNPSEFGELVHNTFGSEWMLYLFNSFLFISEGCQENAEIELEKAREKCPDIFLYHFKLGSYYQLSGKLLQAENHFLEASKIRPEDTQTIWILSEIYEKLNRYADQALRLEELVKIDPDFQNGRFNLGTAYMELGHLERAVALFRYIQIKEPRNQRAKINEAICLRGMRQYKESIRLLEDMKPSTDLEQLAVVSNLAHCYYNLNEGIMAMELFQKMSDMAPESPEPLVYLSKLFLAYKKIEPCVVLCGRLLSLLNIQENRTLTSLTELGELYSKAGKRLTSCTNNSDLGRICFEIGDILGCRRHNIMSETI